MARKRAQLLLRSNPSVHYPPCDMRRYVEMIAGRMRKDMSKVPRINPCMGVGPLTRAFIVDDLTNFLAFDNDFRQGAAFPTNRLVSDGPTGLSDAAMFLWRHHLYYSFLHKYIPADTPWVDIKSDRFIAGMEGGIYLMPDFRYLPTANHALDVVAYDGRLYKRLADFIITHYFTAKEYLADRELLEVTGWDLSNYQPPGPETEAADGGWEIEDDDHDPLYED